MGLISLTTESGRNSGQVGTELHLRFSSDSERSLRSVHGCGGGECSCSQGRVRSRENLATWQEESAGESTGEQSTGHLPSLAPTRLSLHAAQKERSKRS